jgi:hypothetical protein
VVPQGGHPSSEGVHSDPMAGGPTCQAPRRGAGITVAGQCRILTGLRSCAPLPGNRRVIRDPYPG